MRIKNMQRLKFKSVHVQHVGCVPIEYLNATIAFIVYVQLVLSFSNANYVPARHLTDSSSPARNRQQPRRPNVNVLCVNDS